MIMNENMNKENAGEYNMTSKEINPNDVLCGRGGLTNSHVGNKTFRRVVADYQLEYLRARKNDKKDIARRVVNRIKNDGGRFLERRSAASSVWSVASEKRAVEKTSQALREGLDVRHKKMRPRKFVPKRGRKYKSGSNTAKGIVIDSHKINEGLQDDIPDLVNDESSAISFEPFITFPQQTLMNPIGEISEKDCETVLQI